LSRDAHVHAGDSCAAACIARWRMSPSAHEDNE